MSLRGTTWVYLAALEVLIRRMQRACEPSAGSGQP
jgi:hypothetical protein